MSQPDLFGSRSEVRQDHMLRPGEAFTTWECSAWGLLDALPPASVDLVLVDPAYPSLEKHRAKGTTTRLSQSKASSSEWFEVMSYDDMRAMLRGMYQALALDLKMPPEPLGEVLAALNGFGAAASVRVHPGPLDLGLPSRLREHATIDELAGAYAWAAAEQAQTIPYFRARGDA